MMCDAVNGYRNAFFVCAKAFVMYCSGGVKGVIEETESFRQLQSLSFTNNYRTVWSVHPPKETKMRRR